MRSALLEFERTIGDLKALLARNELEERILADPDSDPIPEPLNELPKAVPGLCRAVRGPTGAVLDATSAVVWRI